MATTLLLKALGEIEAVAQHGTELGLNPDMDMRRLIVIVTLASGASAGCSSDNAGEQSSMRADGGGDTHATSGGTGGTHSADTMSASSDGGAGGRHSDHGAGGAEDATGAGGMSGSGGAGSGGAGSGGAAAAGSGGAAAMGSGGTSAPMFQQQWRSCSVADDCVAVRSNTCCGCADIAVNRAFETEAHAALNATDLAHSPPVGCATEGCHDDARAGCNAGACVTLPGCSQRAPTLEECEADDTCHLYSARPCQNASATPIPVCATPGDASACSSTPVCRVNPNTAVMLLFEDGCVPDGWNQDCPVACQ